MSITEPTADGVQPDQGQGDGGQTGDLPYADYLSRLSDEVRGEAQPVFHDWNAHVNKQFEQHAEYRKGWEPYEQLGVNSKDPELVKWALEFAEAASSNPEAIRDWYGSYAQERGLTPAEAAAQAAEQPAEDYSFLDPSLNLDKVLGEKLGPLQQQLEQFAQWRADIEQQAQLEKIDQIIEQEIAALREQHGKDLPEGFDFKDTVNRFASPYATAGADPKQVVAKAWADFQAVANQLQTAALQAKVDQPAPAETAGVPDVSPPPLGKGQDALRAAQRIALEQLRQNRAA